jgi:outer membrane lipoprotein-sorting protein
LLGLEMTPKRERDRELVSKIELWVDQASWMPERQVVVAAAGGATLTTRYSNMSRNLALNSDLFRDKWPKGTKKERM